MASIRFPDTDVSLSFRARSAVNWGRSLDGSISGYIFVNDMRLGLYGFRDCFRQPQDTVASTGGESTNTGMGMVPLKGTPYSVVRIVSLAAGHSLSGSRLTAQ